MVQRAAAADAPLMADELCLMMEGVYVSRQVTGWRDVIGVTRRIAEDLIQRHLGRAKRLEADALGLPVATAE